MMLFWKFFHIVKIFFILFYCQISQTWMLWLQTQCLWFVVAILHSMTIHRLLNFVKCNNSDRLFPFIWKTAISLFNTKKQLLLLWHFLTFHQNLDEIKIQYWWMSNILIFKVTIYLFIIVRLDRMLSMLRSLLKSHNMFYVRMRIS